jgi:hypothetical protein
VGKWSLNFTGELGGMGLGTNVLVLDSPIDPTAEAALRSLGISFIPEPGTHLMLAMASFAASLGRRARRSGR